MRYPHLTRFAVACFGALLMVAIIVGFAAWISGPGY